MNKTINRDTIRAARVIRTAQITGVSKRQVRRVCEGKCQNENVISVMVRMAQAEEMLDNLLINEIKSIVQL